MADSSETKSTGLPIPALAYLLLALSGILVQHLNPLDSSRPGIPDKTNAQYVNIEDVNARLWQDPFTAILQHDSSGDTDNICLEDSDSANNKSNGKDDSVLKHSIDAARLVKEKRNAYTNGDLRSVDKKSKDKKRCASKHGIDAFVHLIKENAKDNTNITVLGVMVSGGSYAENIESRRRTRYAVLSGLAVKDYAPEDSEHIGYVESIGNIGGKKAEYMQFMPEKIPFEWFKDDKNEHPPVLVLWLDDSAFASSLHPLQMTDEFVKSLNKKTKTVNLTFKFIGPANSNTLQVMIDEYSDAQKKTAVKYDLQYYNSMATGDRPGINIPASCDESGLKVEKNIQTYIESQGLPPQFIKGNPDACPLDVAVANAFLPEEVEAKNFSALPSIKSSPSDYQAASIQTNAFALEGVEAKNLSALPAIKSSPSDYQPASIQTKASAQKWFEAQNLSTSSYIKNLQIIRATLTDKQLASALVDELARRDFIPPEATIYPDKMPPNNRDHIVIISEWDTVYGRRGLPMAMKEKFVPMKSYCSEDNMRINKCVWPADVNWIHPYSYMRGLDGVIPGVKTDGESKANKDKEKNNSTQIDLERPEGENQQDYLRRLAVRIDELKQTLENKGEKIKAIGVLGSDAYDKLMILKALRPYFPKAIFFTTDLDTRLMHSKEFDVTRNLIVAASFDLRLADKLQKSIPPFRDSYQSANFFATQIALDDANGKAVSQQKIDNMLGTARLFETGNNKAIALNYSNQEKDTPFFTKFSKAIGYNKDDDACKDLQTCTNVHPVPAPKNWRLFLSALLVAIIFLACIWYKKTQDCLKKCLRWVKIELTNCEPGTTPYRAVPGIVIKLSRWTRFLSLIVFIGIVWLTYAEINLGEKGEPFFWNAGVSVWPSEFIRLFAGILGCLFITKTITAVTRNNQQLTKDFHLSHPSLGGWDVTNLWREHCDKIHDAKLLGKIAGCFGLFIAVALILMGIFGFPYTPYRGGVSNYANMGVLFFSVIVLVFLIMTVLIITLHSIGLITKLDKGDYVWSEESLRQFGLRPRWSVSPTDDLKELRDKLKFQKDYHLDKWQDIKFIAAHTAVVGQLVYYPFIILALMIFARSKIFDNWDMPISLVIVLLLAAVITLGSAFYLRRVAVQTREHVVERISSMKIALSYQTDPKCSAMEKQIDLALTQIQEINVGAFQPLTHDPAFQALLIPFGGMGGVMWLENFVLGF